MDGEKRNGLRPDPNGPVGALVEELREQAAAWEPLGVRVDGAKTNRRHAEQIEQRFFEYLTEPLTVAEAAEYSGYSADHLRDLVRRGQLPDVARDEPKQGAEIRIPRHCLPRKPIHQRRSSTEDNDFPPPDSDRSGDTRVGRALEDVAAGHSSE